MPTNSRGTLLPCSCGSFPATRPFWGKGSPGRRALARARRLNSSLRHRLRLGILGHVPGDNALVGASFWFWLRGGFAVRARRRISLGILMLVARGVVCPDAARRLRTIGGGFWAPFLQALLGIFLRNLPVWACTLLSAELPKLERSRAPCNREHFVERTHWRHQSCMSHRQHARDSVDPCGSLLDVSLSGHVLNSLDLKADFGAPESDRQYFTAERAEVSEECHERSYILVRLHSPCDQRGVHGEVNRSKILQKFEFSRFWKSHASR